LESHELHPAEFKNRPAYIEGCFSEDVDLSIYQNFDEKEENE